MATENRERCAPKTVGFTSEVERLVGEARLRELEKWPSTLEPEEAARLYDSMRDALEQSGHDSSTVESMLSRYEKLTQIKMLRELAAKYRKIWAPDPCPWVGALDDEAKLIAKELFDK